MWKTRSFIQSNGKTLISEWYAAQSEEVQEAFLGRMKFLRGLPSNGWKRPYVGQLRHGSCKGLFEIVISVSGVEHRPVGFFSGEMEFTFLAFATERDGKFDPIMTCNVAQKRKDIILNDKERSREFTIYG
jgi:hypothetical protein